MRHFVGMPASRWLAGAGLASALCLAPQSLPAEEGAAAIFRSGSSLSMPASPRPTSNALELFSPTTPAARPQQATVPMTAPAFPATVDPVAMPVAPQAVPVTATVAELDSFRAVPADQTTIRSGFSAFTPACETNCDRPAAFPVAASPTSTTPLEADDWQARPVMNAGFSPTAATASQPETDDFRPYHERPAIWNTAAPVPVQRAPFSRVTVSEPSVAHSHFESFDAPAAMPGTIQQVSAVSVRDFSQTHPAVPTAAESALVNTVFPSGSSDDRASEPAEVAIPSNDVRMARGGAMLLQPISTAAPAPEVVRPTAVPQFGGAWESSGRNEWRSIERGPRADAAPSARNAAPQPARPAPWEAEGKRSSQESPFGSSHGAFRPQ